MAIDKQIQASSPFKVHYPSSDYLAYSGGLTSAVLNVWIYTGAQGGGNTTSGGLNADASIAGASGDRDNKPSKVLKSTAVGTLGNEFVSFDIANIVKSRLKQEFTGEDNISSVAVNPNTIMWVDYQLTTKTGGTETIHPLLNCVAYDGYTYFEEGLNAQVSEGALVSADTISVVEGEEVFIPVLAEGFTSITFYDGDGNPVPTSTSTPSSSTESYEQIKYVGAIGASSVIVNYTDSGIGKTNTLTINSLECNKHTPYRISFLNRYGAIQSMWFNGNNTESTMVKTKEYNRVATSSVNGSEYSTARGSRYKQRQSSTKAMTLNSGFYPENCNVTFEELIDSTEVWIEKDSVILPINIKTSSFNKKTAINDNAINYTINIEYAFNKINNI